MHFTEELEPGDDTVPLGHDEQDVAVPPAEKEFAAHSRHAPPLWYLPAIHVHAAEEFEPGGDVVPLGHCVQDGAAPPTENEPAPQTRHARPL